MYLPSVYNDRTGEVNKLFIVSLFMEIKIKLHGKLSRIKENPARSGANQVYLSIYSSSGLVVGFLICKCEGRIFRQTDGSTKTVIKVKIIRSGTRRRGSKGVVKETKCVYFLSIVI